MPGHPQKEGLKLEPLEGARVMETRAEREAEKSVLQEGIEVNNGGNLVDWVMKPQSIGERAAGESVPIQRPRCCSQGPGISIQHEQREPKFLRIPFEDQRVRTTIEDEQLKDGP